jgi:oligopeptide/dipeptide ABC transporter ATP-binding protein
MRKFRKRMQIIFQDPYASLNPREKIRTVIGHALTQHQIGTPEDREDRIVRLLEQVGLSADYMDRFPHEFSGGQRQRIGIARALAVDPEFVVADEPVSALDVSIQAQVINLLDDLKDALNLTMLFIAHDLAVVEHICDRVIVMYLGRIMEIAPASTLYSAPNHPYTQALLSAIPIPKPGRKHSRVVLKGDIPSPINPPSGCVFRTRCPRAIGDCATIVPTLKPVGPDHFSACIIPTVR